MNSLTVALAAAVETATDAPGEFASRVEALLEEGRDAPEFLPFLKLKVPQLSMLSEDSLAILSGFARASQGAIVEVGPYVGGSTIAMARAIADTDRRILSVEVGGAHDHPNMGTDDILRDLRRNLESHGVAERVTVIAEWAEKALPRLGEQLGDERVGLVFIDANGLVREQLNMLARWMRPDCLIVLDDFAHKDKGATIRPYVAHAVGDGALTEFGIFSRDVWTGRVNGESGLEKIFAYGRFPHDEGLAWWWVLDEDISSDDSDNPERSDLQLFEDDRPLGPAHALHGDIRSVGAGRYFHWLGVLLFSTSDTSNPNLNGRRYRLVHKGVAVTFNDRR